MPNVTESRLIAHDFTADLQGNNTGSLTWRVHTDGFMNPSDVLYSSYTSAPDPVPRRGTYVGEGMYVLSTTVRMEHQLNKLIWVLTTQTGKLPSDTNENDAQEDENGVFNNPLRRRCVWWMERSPEVEERDTDALGKPFLNSAGQPFDTKIVIERHQPVIVCQKNFATLDEILKINDENENKINRSTFRSYSRYRVLFKGAEASQPQYQNGIEYYTATMRFHTSPRSWQPKLLNRGWAYKDKPNGVLIPATNADGSLAIEPVLLAADGTKLPDGAEPTYSEFNLYLTEDFNSFTGDP